MYRINLHKDGALCHSDYCTNKKKYYIVNCGKPWLTRVCDGIKWQISKKMFNSMMFEGCV